MSYMKQIAQMFGVKFEEEFYVDTSFSELKCKINDKGLFVFVKEYNFWEPENSTLANILKEKYKIVKKPLLDEVEKKYSRSMKDNIENALEFLVNIFGRLLPFVLLMSLIALINTALISIFNLDIALKVGLINISIGIIPFAIVFLLIAILTLISLIIYGDY